MPQISSLPAVSGTTNVESTGVMVVNVGSTTMQALVHQIIAGIFSTAGEIPYAVSSVESTALAPPTSASVLIYSSANDRPSWSIGSSGQVLETTGGAVAWRTLTGSLGSTAGTSGQLLQTTGGAATWIGITSGAILYGNSSGEVTELAPGSSGEILQTTGGTIAWRPEAAGGLDSTAGTSGQLLQTTGGSAAWRGITSGAILYGNSSGEITELAPGSSGQVLQTTAGLPAWRAAPAVGGIDTTAGSSGQILQTSGGAAAWRGTSAVLADLAPPTTAGGKLVAKSSVAVAWIDDDWSVTFVMDAGAGNDLTTGIVGTFEVPWAAGIEDARLSANTTVSSASFAVDIYIDDFTSTPASSLSKITGGDPPTISSGNQRTSGITSSWTTAITARDFLTIDVIDASSGIQRADLSLYGKKLSSV
jgi:hypothetical protein